ncbi:PREDICTED: mitochondrial inner membrane protein OXA1-like [Camelina sativa]|uniref:Mitochondrial inner membrane protein OXA1-like n=1 Tax=Camelina sativa TaxID=90675 RepID=A0ABM0ZNP0_CAMSA|nr:PREDICTED: mitochondrial inner membrane protein OXA1-like [Camelina sativa]
MACLRSFSRRSLYPKWFCYKTSSRPADLLQHHHIKDSTGSSLPDSSLLIRSFHRQVFSEDRRTMSFVQSMGSSGVLLCSRHMSSKPEELCPMIDAFGNVAEELVSDKSVGAMATVDQCSAAIENFSFPGDFVHYVINGIHELTGLNWWMSILLTAFLVNVLMSPVSMRVQRHGLELQILIRTIEKVQRIKKVGNRETLAKSKKWEAELMKGFEDRCFSFLTHFVPDAFVYISFMSGITTMAKKIPELSTSDSLYIMPLLAGFTFWFSSEIHNRRSLLSRMKRLPLFPIIFVVLQATYEYEPAVYFYMITSRIYVSTLLLMLRNKQIVKLRSILGWPDVPVTTVSQQQKVMARLICRLREFIDVVKKNDKK